MVGHEVWEPKSKKWCTIKGGHIFRGESGTSWASLRKKVAHKQQTLAEKLFDQIQIK